jgi:hypothetical protein
MAAATKPEQDGRHTASGLARVPVPLLPEGRVESPTWMATPSSATRLSMLAQHVTNVAEHPDDRRGPG